jgi:D-alanyl-D-alanine carboxypeptidase (penicillin-binding protein 5/6)
MRLVPSAGAIAAAGAITAVVLAFPALASSASPAGPPVPSVQAGAYVIENAATGEVLASSNAHERLPIASITKLMTVLVVLQHRKLSDVVTVDPRAAAVGEESIYLTGGERITVSDLLKGALIQSANDAADALALSVAPSFPAFAKLMNAKAAELGLHDTHFVRPDGLDAPGAYSSAADVTAVARIAMRTRFVRDTVREPTATIQGGQVLHTWDDLLGTFPNVLGVKTGHTGNAGWCQVAAVRGRGVTVYVTILGSPSRSVRNAGLESLLSWGVAQFRVVTAIASDRDYASVSLPYGLRAVPLRATKALLAVARIGRPFVERVSAERIVALPVRAGEVLGRVQVWSGGKLVGSRDLVATRSVARPDLAGRVRWYARRTVHHLLRLFSSP